MALDEIDRTNAIAGATELRSALAHLEQARHMIGMAAASSGLSDATDIFVPLASILTYLAIKIAAAEAEVNRTDRPFPVLRVVEGGKR